MGKQTFKKHWTVLKCKCILNLKNWIDIQLIKCNVCMALQWLNTGYTDIGRKMNTDWYSGMFSILTNYSDDNKIWKRYKATVYDVKIPPLVMSLICEMSLLVAQVLGFDHMTNIQTQC